MELPGFIEINRAADAARDQAETAAQDAMQQADAIARQTVEAGARRLEEQRRQGINVINNVNNRALEVAKEYEAKVKADIRRYEEMADNAQRVMQAKITLIRSRYAEGVAALDRAARTRRDIRQQIDDLANTQQVGGDFARELLKLEQELADELNGLASELKAFGGEVAAEIKAAALDVYEKTLEPIVEWFQQEVFTPLFGHGPGILQNVKDWASQNAKQLKDLSQVASVFLGVVRLAGGLYRAVAPKQNRCIDNAYSRDFEFQYSRWSLMMNATKGASTKAGFRLPVYDHVFRWRLLQPFTVLQTLQVGQCNPWEGGLRLVKVDCAGWGTGDYFRPTNPVWHFIGDTKRKQIADIWQVMGWDEFIPRDCREGPYLDNSNLLNQRGAYPSDAEWNERYMQSTAGKVLFTEYEGWPRISERESGSFRPVSVPYPAGSGAPYVGFDNTKGVGQCLPEIPLTHSDQIPLLYLAFWFAPPMSPNDAKRLVTAYEKVMRRWEVERGYTINGFKIKKGGDLLPGGGLAWGDLRQIDAVPVLLDAPLTTQLFMQRTSNVAPGNALSKTVLEFVNMYETPELRSGMHPDSYLSALKKIDANRGTRGLVASRSVQKAKNPVITASVKWSNAILAGSEEAARELRELLAKVDSGNASPDDVVMINALQLAMYGPGAPVPARFGRAMRLRLE